MTYSRRSFVLSSAVICLTACGGDSANGSGSSVTGSVSPTPTPPLTPTPTTPAPAPLSLPALTTAYSAARGTQRIIAGYTGPLFRLRSASGAVARDFPAAVGSNLPDYTAIEAFLTANGTSYFAKIYDQTGHGFDLILPTGNYPAQGGTFPVDLGQKTPSGALWVNSADTTGGEMASTGHAINNRDFSFFAAVRVASNGPTGFIFSIDNGTSTLECAITGPASNNVRSRSENGGVVAFGSNLPLRANPISFGWTNTATARRLYMNETNTAAEGAPQAGTATRLQYFGYPKSFQLPGYIQWAGDALTAAALSANDGTTLQSAIASIFSVPTSFDRRLLVIGDSIAYGDLAGYHRQIWTQIAYTTNSNVELIVTAVPGEQMAAEQSGGTALVYITSAYGAGKMVTVVSSGTNDLAPALGNRTYTELSSVALSFVSAIKRSYVGGRVLQAQILPQEGPSWTTTAEGYRNSYNDDVANNAFGADAVFLEGDGMSTMGAAGAVNDRTLYNPDKVHPTMLGDTYLATGQPTPPRGLPSYQAAINSLWS